MPQTDAAITEVLGHMGKQIDILILPVHPVLIGFLGIRLEFFPGVGIIPIIILVIAGNDPFMQLHHHIRLFLPYNLVVALACMGVAQLLHTLPHRIVLLLTDQNVHITHQAHFRRRIHLFQGRSFQKGIIHVLFVKCFLQTAQAVRLNIITGDDLQCIHHRIFPRRQIRAGFIQAVQQHRKGLMLFSDF